MSKKIAIGTILLCVAGIGFVINETVNEKLNVLICSNNAILVDNGPIRQTSEGVYHSMSGMSYIPMPGSICSVEFYEELETRLLE